MAYEFGRFFWWLQHEPNAPATFVQSCAVVVTTIVTTLLCGVTYKYMVLTRHLARMATEQLRAAVRPVINLRLYFQGGQDSVGGIIFSDEVAVELTNVGNAPLVIKKLRR